MDAFSDRVALVTGGTRGIGADARELTHLGAKQSYAANTVSHRRAASMPGTTSTRLRRLGSQATATRRASISGTHTLGAGAIARSLRLVDATVLQGAPRHPDAASRRVSRVVRAGSSRPEIRKPW